MKKSVKEQVEASEFWTNYGTHAIAVSVAMRIIRRACKEAYERGWYNSTFGGDDKRTQDVVSDIINGPKKGKRK